MPKGFLKELFKEENENNNLNVYVIIDSAKIKKLTNELIVIDAEKQQILFEGKEAIELEEVAPYLIELKKEDEFTTWVAKNVYGNNGAIFIKSTENINDLAEHLKPFIPVTREVEHEGKVMIQKGYVAYYDPRVFPDWIESKSQEKQKNFFSKINKIYGEDVFKSNAYVSYVFNENLEIQNKEAYAVEGLRDE